MVLLDEALGLLWKPLQVMFFAQRQLVLAHVDRRLSITLAAFHISPSLARHPASDLASDFPPDTTAINLI
jgi:hypothetical protein